MLFPSSYPSTVYICLSLTKHCQMPAEMGGGYLSSDTVQNKRRAGILCNPSRGIKNTHYTKRWKEILNRVVRESLLSIGYHSSSFNIPQILLHHIFIIRLVQSSVLRNCAVNEPNFYLLLFISSFLA